MLSSLPVNAQGKALILSENRDHPKDVAHHLLASYVVGVQ